MNIEYFNASIFLESINARDFHTPTHKYLQSSDRLVFFEVMILKRTLTCLQHLESTLSIERVKNVKMNYFRWFELKGWSVYKPQTPETGTNKLSSRIYLTILQLWYFSFEQIAVQTLFQ